MFSNILIGIDGGTGGRDAVALALQLAAPGAHVTLGRVWARVDALAAAATGAQDPSAQAHEVLAGERARLGLRCTTVARQASSTAAGLDALATEFGCDLIVLGTARPRHPGQPTAADPGRDALHGAPCAVAVAPRGHAHAARRIERIGVGYEENALGAHTLAGGQALAADLAAELRLLTVMPPAPSVWAGPAFGSLLELEDLLGRTHQQDRLEHLGADEVELRDGDAGDGLVAFSAEVDLLVLGSHRHRALWRALTGSTADRLVQRSACPVLVLMGPVVEAPSARPPAVGVSA